MDLKLVSWNVHGRARWRSELPEATDIALIQEAPADPQHERIRYGPGRALVENISGRVDLRHESLASIPVAAAGGEGHPASYPGTLDVVLATDRDTGNQAYFVSIYVKWEHVGHWIAADTSAHRLISDISALVTTQQHAIPIVEPPWV